MDLLDTAYIVVLSLSILGAATTYKKKCYDIATLLCMLATCMSAVNLSLELLLDAPAYCKITSIAMIVVMLVGAIDSIRRFVKYIYGPPYSVDHAVGNSRHAVQVHHAGKISCYPGNGLDPDTVRTICSMFHTEGATRGYMPDTPIGKIAREGMLHWLRVHAEAEYSAQWVRLSDMFPQKGDLSARGEVLAQDKDGYCHVCDPFNNITREDGHIEWFNGDRYIVPEVWMKIPLW
jgi:hypothetical protein